MATGVPPPGAAEVGTTVGEAGTTGEEAGGPLAEAMTIGVAEAEAEVKEGGTDGPF